MQDDLNTVFSDDERTFQANERTLEVERLTFARKTRKAEKHIKKSLSVE